jgi:ABC-type multidrug transport system permease subunit
MSNMKKKTYPPLAHKVVAFIYFILFAAVFIGFLINFLKNGVYSSILYSVPIMAGCLIVGGYHFKKGSDLKGNNT